jgi:hypothetical protein
VSVKRCERANWPTRREHDTFRAREFCWVVLQGVMARRNGNSVSQVRTHTIERESDSRLCVQCDGTRLQLGSAQVQASQCVLTRRSVGVVCECNKCESVCLNGSTLSLSLSFARAHHDRVILARHSSVRPPAVRAWRREGTAEVHPARAGLAQEVIRCPLGQCFDNHLALAKQVCDELDFRAVRAHPPAHPHPHSHLHTTAYHLHAGDERCCVPDAMLQRWESVHSRRQRLPRHPTTTELREQKLNLKFEPSPEILLERCVHKVLLGVGCVAPHRPLLHLAQLRQARGHLLYFISGFIWLRGVQWAWQLDTAHAWKRSKRPQQRDCDVQETRGGCSGERATLLAIEASMGAV